FIKLDLIYYFSITSNEEPKVEGNLQSKPRGKPQFSHLINADIELTELVASHPDATLIELCELFADKTGNFVGRSAMCRALQKLGLNRKKKQSGVPKQARRES
ncbi:hypothetical protein, partial [Nostoc sp. NMS9]|uniref:hypothetical protein n=1 Tax=Nostoc sp. NMS9 TaxID=2815393 RepID=UPI0025E990D8